MVADYQRNSSYDKNMHQQQSVIVKYTYAACFSLKVSKTIIKMGVIQNTTIFPQKQYQQVILQS